MFFTIKLSNEQRSASQIAAVGHFNIARGERAVEIALEQPVEELDISADRTGDIIGSQGHGGSEQVLGSGLRGRDYTV